MTIHITPEPEFSYVSFESNIASSNYGDLIARVIETFQPGKFVVTILANKVCFFYIIQTCIPITKTSNFKNKNRYWNPMVIFFDKF